MRTEWAIVYLIGLAAYFLRISDLGTAWNLVATFFVSLTMTLMATVLTNDKVSSEYKK
jgi:hypothetical protein